MLAAILLAATLQPCRAIALQYTPARIQWRLRMAVWSMRLAGKIVVAQNSQGLSAVEPWSGRVLWSRPLKRSIELIERRIVAAEEYAILTDRVAVIDEPNLVLLDIRSGKEIRRVHFDRPVRSVAGPHLIAVTDRRPGSTLYALDDDGSIRARRLVRTIHELDEWGDVVTGRLDGSLNDPQFKVAGFDAHTLEPLWIGVGGSSELHIEEIGGRPHYRDGPAAEGPQPIDIRTGKLGAPLPAREARDGNFSVSTWEFEVVTGTQGCQRLRRNDPVTARPRWEIDLPLTVDEHLNAGDTFYVSGSSDPSHHVLVALDWSSGRVLGAWSGVPEFRELVMAGDQLIGRTNDELVALHR